MKTIDLRRQLVNLDELLKSVGDEALQITSKDGHRFILEPADAFEREVSELAHTAKFMAFLAERSSEPKQTSLADLERGLAAAEETDGHSDLARQPK